MPRARPPVWTARPGRFSRLSRRAALALSAAALLLVLGGLIALWGAPPMPPDALFGEAAVREGLVAGIRAGGDYYSVAESVHRGGEAGGSWAAIPLPALAMLLGALSPLYAFVVQALLVLAVFVAWFVRLRREIPRLAPIAAVGFLLAAGLVTAIDPLLAPLSALWAGLFVALSLASHRPGRWIEPVALGMVAMAFSPAALLYAAVMAIFALRQGDQRETAGWMSAIAIFLALFLAHGLAVRDFLPDAPIADLAPALGGYAGFLQSATLATALQLLPLPLGAILIALALLGWASWDDPTAFRVLATIGAYGLATALFAPADAAHWALLTSPLLPLGLVFAPDAVRDLAATLLDRKRVRVQRISR